MNIFNFKKKTKSPRDLLHEKIMRGNQGFHESYDEAIKVGTKNTFEGIKMEYSYIEKFCGKYDVDWSIITKSTSENNGKMYDVFVISDNDGNERKFYFDISIFYGKFD